MAVIEGFTDDREAPTRDQLSREAQELAGQAETLHTNPNADPATVNVADHLARMAQLHLDRLVADGATEEPQTNSSLAEAS